MGVDRRDRLLVMVSRKLVDQWRIPRRHATQSHFACAFHRLTVVHVSFRPKPNPPCPKSPTISTVKILAQKSPLTLMRLLGWGRIYVNHEVRYWRKDMFTLVVLTNF